MNQGKYGKIAFKEQSIVHRYFFDLVIFFNSLNRHDWLPNSSRGIFRPTQSWSLKSLPSCIKAATLLIKG